ncbi:MAG: GGDEF domain-containing protein, partial [Candidatus Omnitrophota bacterium]
RYGGEEFCVLLPETNKHGAVFVAERLRNFVASNKIKAYDEEVGMTISVGVATFPHDANTAKDLIERADEALYKAKAEGRNRVVDYSPGTDKREL